VDTYRCAHNGQHPYSLSIRPDGHAMTLTALSAVAEQQPRQTTSSVLVSWWNSLAMLSVTGLGSVWIFNAGSFTPKRYRVSNDFQTELAEEAGKDEESNSF